MTENTSNSGSDWTVTLERILEYPNSVGKDEAISCLVSVMEDSGLEWSPWGERGALFRRIVFTFNDDYKTLVWQGREEGIFVSMAENELREDSPFPYRSLDESHFQFSAYANGWRHSGDLKVQEIVRQLEDEIGSATLILPWLDFGVDVADDDVDAFIETYYPEAEDEDSELRTEAELLYTLYSRIGEESLELPDALGEVIYDHGDMHMPRYSGAGRLNAFLNDLESKHNWGIVFDECCGSCSSNSVDEIRSEEGKEDSPVFITWAQNADGAWGTDGWVNHMDSHPDEREREVIKEVAEENGLRFALELDGDGKPNGIVIITSV